MGFLGLMYEVRRDYKVSQGRMQRLNPSSDLQSYPFFIAYYLNLFHKELYNQKSNIFLQNSMIFTQILNLSKFDFTEILILPRTQKNLQQLQAKSQYIIRFMTNFYLKNTIIYNKNLRDRLDLGECTPSQKNAFVDTFLLLLGIITERIKELHDLHLIYNDFLDSYFF